MADIIKSPLREENEPVADSKEEIHSPKTNQKRKSSESISIKRKKVHIGIEGTEQSSEPCCSSATVDNVLEDMEEEIDSALEQPCFKDKLTPTNVKSILRHIIANEYVLTMVRNTMKPNEGGEVEPTFEPKLTRSKAKEMRKQQCSLPWPVASPAKTVQKVSKKLLEEEFPDESSGDEDYRPEEECHSEDDAAASSKASDGGTPRSSRRQSLPSSPVSKTTDMMSEDENALVIALPELDIPLDPSEADKIALRTRSKFCLNDTPLEEIEASFIAPDITMDMYDARCDDEDWQSFLSELVKPIDPTSTFDNPDDAENDPEYKAIEDEAPDYEDLRYERITTDEWNDLMLGTYELAQEDLSFLDDEDEEEEPRVEVEFNENTTPDLSTWMTSDERLQLDEQLRMYVQLLTQSHLLSHGNSALENLNESTKIFLEEIKMFATRERASSERSFFYAHNLDGALDIVKKFENTSLPFDLKDAKQTKKHLPLVPPHIKQTLASSKVFIYPELLPTCGFRNNIEIGKKFNTPEDNLIALGLEQFENLRDPIECIHKYLIPIKSVERITARIKNCKIKTSPISNSIKFYHKFKQAPKFQRVIRIFDPENIKSPKDYTPDFLPKWMESFSKFSTSNPVIPGTVPASSKTPSPKAPVSLLPSCKKTLTLRKYTPILPRGLYISPLRFINPILKKYSKRRPRAPSICDSESPYKPPPLKPKPRPYNFNSESNSDNKKTTKANANVQKKVVAPSICNSGSPLKPKPRLSNSNSESDMTNSDSDETSKPNAKVKVVAPSINDSKSPYKPKQKLSNSNSESNTTNSDTEINMEYDSNSQDKVVVEDTQTDAIEFVPSPAKNADCAERRRKRHAARQAVWVSLSGREPSVAAKSSKEKTVATNKVDERTCDEEGESSVVLTVSPSKKSAKKKKNRRDLETSLALLLPDVAKEAPMKEEQEVMFANSYLLRATEILKGDSEVYEKFLSTLCKYHLSARSPVELYSELKDILTDYPALVKDFIVFLRPEQAKECGRYKEHIALSKVREFFRKIEIHFKDQPEHISQILRTFAQLQEQVDLTSAEVIRSLKPLLKNQPHLFKEVNDILSSSK